MRLFKVNFIVVAAGLWLLHTSGCAIVKVQFPLNEYLFRSCMLLSSLSNQLTETGRL